MNLTFIGGGNMASAIIGGLINGGADTRAFRVVDPLPAQQDKLVGQFPGIGIFGETSAGAIDGADIVVLAVKPQQMRSAAQALSSYVPDVPVVMSIAAGVRLADIGRWLGGFPRLVRAMPNTPALIGEGISGAFALPEAGARGRKLAQRVLEGVGDVLWVGSEELLDAITGVSGSGPAYVFYFLEGLEQAARELGFSKADARKLAYATFAGTVKLGAGSDLEPGILRAQVTSKGGTTERAIGVLEAGSVKEHFVAAVKAATARAREMGDALGAEG
ncbi:MAG TPA: pyrroline-5-carboxylate reductase [Casimicrobiaceae bacterium]|nr:pyrroline-5-carboxylate reductase [Casimicrobiaceae bacterium]